MRLELAGLGAVVFAGGFRPDYRSWLRWPEAWDEPASRCRATAPAARCRGVYFVGVHFLRKRKSSLLIGVGEGAAIVARAIADTVAA